MPTELKCTHCACAIELPDTASGTTVTCPSCQEPVEIPTKESGAIQPATGAPERTASSEALGWTILGGLVGLGVLIAWLGWTTFVTILLWIVIVGAVLVGAGFGLVALDKPTKDAKDRFYGVGVICVIVAVLAWNLMPASQSGNATTTAGPETPVVTDAMLQDRLIGVWATQIASDAKILYTFRADGSFLRRFQSNNLLKDVGALAFGADQITGRWSIHNRRLYVEWDRGGDFNPASGVLKGTMTGGHIQDLTESTLHVPGLDTPAGAFQRVQ